jgi:hypothetical protein
MEPSQEYPSAQANLQFPGSTEYCQLQETASPFVTAQEYWLATSNPCPVQLSNTQDGTGDPGMYFSSHWADSSMSRTVP